MTEQHTPETFRDAAHIVESLPPSLAVVCALGNGAEAWRRFTKFAAAELRQHAEAQAAAVAPEPPAGTPLTAEELAEVEARAAAPEQPAPVPRTEREHWQAIADALNNANRAGMPVGIDLDGVLTDHNEHAVIWNFEAERWDVAGYADDPEHPADEEQPRPHPAVGDRYVKRAEPDAGRIVTVNSVETAEDGRTTVVYEWDDPRASYSGSACPLDVFERTYAPAPCAHQWVTALGGNNHPARDDHGNMWQHCGLCGEAKGREQRAAVPDRPALDLLTEIYEELGHDHRARHLAAALLDQHARSLADQITALGKARGWSTWAADYIHPDREFVDPGTPAEATE